MRRDVILVLCAMAAAWLLGFAAGYFNAKAAAIEARRPKARYSYIDRTPPSCAMQQTRDARHVCEWQRVERVK